MTDRDATATPAVRVRVEGDVDDETIAYLRAKVIAVLHRPALRSCDGEIRIGRAAAHHVEQPWAAGIGIRVGTIRLVVHARAASAHEPADRLQDRLRHRLDRLTHRADTVRRTAGPPPWRGATVRKATGGDRSATQAREPVRCRATVETPRVLRPERAPPLRELLPSAAAPLMRCAPSGQSSQRLRLTKGSRAHTLPRPQVAPAPAAASAISTTA